jgi:hypothetical protein
VEHQAGSTCSNAKKTIRSVSHTYSKQPAAMEQARLQADNLVV